ncbi:sugar-binding transcriptional regulator [Vallicoccus soli]|uniref:Sugar-binding transcriptional regulator n=1 Tax=Vallicoccus soli TaxID=2339232 RepID=A0A3A3Z741_9ACTN|nr:sugar-binding domain-containing protein [Vallicoccus soli]RJK97747.1 sugar-binding transcriptional regulator [Vallicoccus soli]
MPAARDPDVLLRAARLYYEERLSQDEVAARLGTSRSNVSRMLTAAFEQGIVEIRVNDPAGRDGELERALVARYGLDAAVVAVRSSLPGLHVRDRVAALAWQWLRGALRDGMVLALSWGRALQDLVYAVPAGSPVAVEVVQLVGGLSAVDHATTGQELVRELAARLQARYRYLHAPAVLTSATARDTLLAERSVQEQLDAARRADLAVVGIGAVGRGSSGAVLRSLALSPEERAAFEAAGPVGDVAARFFDAHGREVHGPVHDRVLAVTLDELRAVPTVVGVVHGREKVDAVAAALAGGLVDVLVCDDAVARGVLAQPTERAVPA